MGYTRQVVYIFFLKKNYFSFNFYLYFHLIMILIENNVCLLEDGSDVTAVFYLSFTIVRGMSVVGGIYESPRSIMWASQIIRFPEDVPNPRG